MSETAMDAQRLQQDELQVFADRAAAIRAQVGNAVVGQTEVIELVLVALLASGHVLIEGLPGLGKTLLVRSFAKAFGGEAARVQFTPDLMPSDITGHVLFNMQKGAFQTRRGPVFTNLLVADEINRAPAKTQAALLEAMQERQVSLEGQAIALPQPFMTLATQNPLEHEGTYPLPDAQLDRFLLKIEIDYPSVEDEVGMVDRIVSGRIGDRLDTDAVQTVATIEEVIELQHAVTRVEVAREVLEYAVAIVRETRHWPGITAGAGPRGSLALIRAARAGALLDGRAFVTPDDVKSIALPALHHRLAISAELEIEGHRAGDLLQAAVDQVKAPRE